MSIFKQGYQKTGPFTLEDLKVLRRSPDRPRSTTAYNGTNFVLPYMGVADILVK